jgi:hypothetical protein
MAFDPRTVFANLAEKERFKGHHSAEGRAIRTLSRALNGWSSGNLSRLDVLVLCDQSIEDWLKARLKISSWSTPSLLELLEKAVAVQLITRIEAVRLQKLRNVRARVRVDANNIGTQDLEAALEFCIQLVERYW